jgi:hypothetical protein
MPGARADLSNTRAWSTQPMWSPMSPVRGSSARPLAPTALRPEGAIWLLTVVNAFGVRQGGWVLRSKRRRGHPLWAVLGLRLQQLKVSVKRVRLAIMSPRVNTEELIDAHEVAAILGLKQFQSVSTYQRRYKDMPRPAVDLGPGRPRLWLRPEIVEWARKTGRSG